MNLDIQLRAGSFRCAVRDTCECRMRKRSLRFSSRSFTSSDILHASGPGEGDFRMVKSTTIATLQQPASLRSVRFFTLCSFNRRVSCKTLQNHAMLATRTAPLLGTEGSQQGLAGVCAGIAHSAGVAKLVGELLRSPSRSVVPHFKMRRLHLPIGGPTRPGSA